MFDTAIWLLEVCSAVAPNHQQAFREINPMLSANRSNRRLMTDNPKVLRQERRPPSIGMGKMELFSMPFQANPVACSSRLSSPILLSRIRSPAAFRFTAIRLSCRRPIYVGSNTPPAIALKREV